MTQIQYLTTARGYPSGGTWYYEPSESTVSYVVQCVPASTYKITLTEAGTRLRICFFANDPVTATSNLYGTSYLSIDNPEQGYEYSVTPDAAGYLLYYVSNTGEHPEVLIETDGAGGDPSRITVCKETSGTSLSVSVHAFTGDWLLATVTTRSAAAYPEGWTLLHESTMTDVFPQKLAFLCKQATEDTPLSFTAAQEASGRIYINLIRLKDISGFCYHEGTESVFESDTGGHYTVQRSYCSKLIWGCSGYYWSTSRPFPTWSCDVLGEAICIGTSTQSRQANFFDESYAPTREFISPASDAGVVIDCVELVEHIPQYASTGTAVFSVTQLQSISEYAASAIAWTAETPEGTAVSIYAKVDDGEYLLCTSGQSIPCLVSGADYSSSVLYIKAVLTTQQSSISPALFGLQVVINDASDRNTILLHFPSGNTSSLQNAVGDISVSYRGGRLVGYGGPVREFTETFTPEGLIYKGHQNDAENIEVSISVTSAFRMVTYKSTKETEHISVSISAVGQLTDIHDI